MALTPVYKLQNVKKQEYAEALNRYKAEATLYELEQKSVKNQAKKLLATNRGAALQMIEEFDSSESELPLRHRYIVNDSSVEKLGELLSENPNGLLLVRDELAGWLAKLSGEEAQSERAFYLECFDGDVSFACDRIGRGTTEIEKCALSLIGGIQPSRITPLVIAAVKGKNDDGLIQRLQLAVWPDDNRSWKWIDRAPNQAALTRYNNVFERLDALDLGGNACLRFSPDAQPLFIEWVAELQAEIKSGELHPVLESHFIKLQKTIAGLALLFELVEGGSKHVGELATARALEWADFLRSHAIRLYSSANNEGVVGAKLILKRKDKLPSPFTAREVQRKGWAGLADQTEIQQALEVLCEYRWLFSESISTTDRGGRPHINYYWNPMGV